MGTLLEIVREIAWLDDSRMGAIVRRKVGVGEDRRTLDFVVVFEGRRFLGPLRFATGRLTDLAVDRPGRRFTRATTSSREWSNSSLCGPTTCATGSPAS
jgi:hypothetical protein